MPNIKKIVVSGSAISQLTNDAGYALATNITGAFTAVSTSLSTRVTTLEANAGSGGLLSSSAQIATDISGAFTALSGGFSTRITTNETNIATNTTNIGTNTTNIGTLTAATASYALKTDISGAFTAVSTSLSTRVTTLEVNGPTNASTASFVNSNDVEFLNAGENQTLTSVSTSIATRATTLESRTTVLEGTGTIQGVGTTNNVTFANVTATGNVSITGTLFVDGTTTTLNSTNLNIEDKFLLLNSGSTGPSYEGGIIVESGSTGTGNAFYYDASDNRWSLKAGLIATNTAAVTAEAFMSVAVVDTLANATGSAYYKAGNIIVDGQDIYIVTV
jgi:hypothetical protein